MGSLGGAPCHLQAHGGAQQTSVRKSGKRHGARRPRVAASSAVASDVAPAQVGQPVTVAPDDLRLQDGEVSHVVAEPSSSPADVFRCTGCTAEECQTSSGCAKTMWRFEDGGYLRHILTARVYDVAVETPLELAQQLSARSGNNIWFKREDLQPVFSFKLRGAFNKMASLTPEQLTAGVICSSAGNHAQGVALAAQRLGTSAVICMPVNTPEIKVAAVKARGGEVRLVGESYTETQAYAFQTAADENRAFVAPYDDPLTIAGQGTIGVEILKQLGTNMANLDAIFVAIGGGGLIAGIASYVKALKPEVKVIGVEPTGANCMAQSLAHGERVTLSRVDAFADGVAVKSVGAETFRLCQKHCDGVVLVDNAKISAAIKDVFLETRSILEPAGAVAVAGAKDYLQRHNIRGATVVAVTSGANMNFDRLRLVADLANYGLRTEAMLACTIPEHAGSFRAFIETLYGDDQLPVTMANNGAARRGVDVTEFKYRYSVDRDAKILLSISAWDPADVDAAVQRLNAADAQFVCTNVTDNTLAQVHLRHMVGGRPRSYSGVIEDEKMVVVNFPEKAGALRQFLKVLMGATNPEELLNVTMFHYRTTGNRTSSVLLGLQVPSSKEAVFEDVKATLEPLDFAFDELGDRTRQLFDQFIS